MLNLKGILLEIASGAVLLRNDATLMSVIAGEAVWIVTLLIVAI